MYIHARLALLLPNGITTLCSFTSCQCDPSLIVTLGNRATPCANWCTIGPYQKPYTPPPPVYITTPCVVVAFSKHTHACMQMDVHTNTQVKFIL